MSYGVEVVYNKNDVAILDADNVALRVSAKGTASRATVGHPFNATWFSGQSTTYRYNIPVGNATFEPIVLIKWPVGMQLFSVGKVGTNHVLYDPSKTGPATLDYMICDYSAPPEPTSGYGMVIYDDSGNPVFSSEAETLKVKQILPQGPYATKTYPLTFHSVSHGAYPNPYFSPAFADFAGDFGDGAKLGGVKRTTSTSMDRVEMFATDQSLTIFGNPAILIASQ